MKGDRNVTGIFHPIHILFLLQIILSFNTLPSDKILDWPKSKAFADITKILKKVIFVFDTVENIVGKGENAGYQHFLLFPQCSTGFFYSGPLKVEIVW